MKDRQPTVVMTINQLCLTYDALTDKAIDWRNELRRRAKAGETAGGLDRNYNEVLDARDAVAYELRKFGIQRNTSSSWRD